ncbi:MAG: helicase HerA domain-containing protein, partial [Promethearchaeota archaeon]
MEFLIKYLISKSFFSIYVKGTILLNFIVNGLFILYFLILIKNQKIVKIKSIILIISSLFILTIIPIIYLYNSKDFLNQIFATIEIILFIATISIILYYLPKSIPDITLEKPNIKNIRGGILDLGTIFHNKKVFHSYKLKIADLQRHMLVYGQTGTGKTNFIQKLLIELNKKYPSIPFIIFEFKGEYNKLQNKIPNLKIIKPGINFSFNLFESDIFDPQIYVEILFDGLKSCQIIENNADFSPQMEKVLIDVLRKVCTSKKQRSWKFFFDTLQNYIKTFEKSIPLIKQTGISIRNRLRRYYEGSLSRLFNSSKDASKISELLSHNCIINLGEILKIGGNKEDVIFFANLVLKWIWESNIKKTPTDQLRHLTIFEDSSYIASQKILENSKLSSYLEDIALLLRGKGE